MLYAWLLNEDATFEIQISSQIKHVTVHNNQVGIVTQLNTLIWTVGGGTQQIETTNTPEAVLFHPMSQDIIVLTSSQKMDAEDSKHLFIMRFFVEEYTGDK